RSRLSFSNFGSRLDVQGWGENIVSTGGRHEGEPGYWDLRDDPDSGRCYTQSFGGTSGASPIVVGVLACIAGARNAAAKPLVSYSEIRQLFEETGGAQTDGDVGSAAERIGRLPDLRAAFKALHLGG